MTAAATTIILFVLSLFTDVDKELEQAVNVAVPLIVAYFTRNNPTPGGVPLK